MKLEERIIGFERYQEQFSEWVATETIIDDKCAVWELKKPNTRYQKVCLYRDGKDMFVYGDYGQFTFDSMTWIGDVYNLEYDNIGYQMEKLSYESKKALYIFDDDECKKDIVEWCISRIEDGYTTLELNNDNLNVIIEKIKNNICDVSFDVFEFCEQNDCSDIESLLVFTCDLLSNTDEYDWIAYLRNSTDRIEDYDEVCESSLWKAGKIISQEYFICMYALKVCGEKLKENKNV